MCENLAADEDGKQMQSSAERCPLTVARHLSVRQLSNKLGGKSAAKDMACSSLALRMETAHFT